MAKPKRNKKRPVLTDGMLVMGFTHADDDRWLPPRFVFGEVEIQYIAMFGSKKVYVGGIGADEATLRPIPNPSAKLLRILKKKSRDWAEEDEKIAKRRARKDNTFREKKIDKESGVNLVRKDAEKAFYANCDEERREDQRLMSERMAEVTALIDTIKE